MANQETASKSPHRPTVSDGKAMRAIWRPSDGNGDPDPNVYESTRYVTSGHPTWKLYCGNAPHNINGTFVEPPKHVYLDDRACYKIYHFAGYNGAERGRLWRHDFDNKGSIKPNRKCRGRPAFTQDGSVCEIQTGAAKMYRFDGAEDRKEVSLIFRELDAQAKGEMLIVPTPTTKKGTNAKPKRKVSEDLLNGVDTIKSNATPDDGGLSFTDKRIKKPRLTDQTIAAISSNSISELKATIISLQDRARVTSDALLDLQKLNAQLDASLKSQQILYHRSSVDLASVRTLNNELMAQIREKSAKSSPMMQKDMEIAVLRNQVAIYRGIAAQLWAGQKMVEAMVEKSSKSAGAIEELTETLVDMREELQPMKDAHEEAKKEWESTKSQMKVMLGDAWDAFDREAGSEYSG